MSGFPARPSHDLITTLPLEPRKRGESAEPDYGLAIAAAIRSWRLDRLKNTWGQRGRGTTDSCNQKLLSSV